MDASELYSFLLVSIFGLSGNPKKISELFPFYNLLYGKVYRKTKNRIQFTIGIYYLKYSGC